MGTQVIAGPFSAVATGTTAISAASTTLIIPAPQPGYVAVISKLIMNGQCASTTANFAFTVQFVDGSNNTISGLPTFRAGPTPATANTVFTTTLDFGAGPTAGGFRLPTSAFPTADAVVKISTSNSANAQFIAGFVSWYYDKA